MLTPDIRALMEMWPHYDKGFLPMAGGLMDQSPQFLQAMALLDQTVREVAYRMARERADSA